MDLFTKMLLDSKENDKFLCLYEYSDDDKFWFGKVIDFNEEIIIFQHYTKFGKKEGKKKYTTLFLQNQIDYKVSVGYILPVFSAFRVLLIKDRLKGTLKWISDPKKMWDKIGAELVKNTLDSSRNNPQDAGKNGAIWSNNYSKVENELFREMLDM